MKSAVLCFAIASLTYTSTAYSQDTCATAGGHPGGVGPVTGYGTGAVNPLDPFSFRSSLQPTANAAIRTAAPQARITVVDAASPIRPQANSGRSSTPTVRLTVVDDDSPNQQPVVNAVGTTKLSEAVKPAAAIESTSSNEVDDSKISDALKGLVGTWKAVARRGDGELTTVELRLDDRGWAELTVPDADGKPSTIKRRAELEGQELKLTGPDAELLLGQLIDVNSRQMVLARAGGQVTFVRP